jgi:CheY-like chemotaxis protein
MAMKIVILEDNPERVRAMRECLTDRFSRFECRFFDEAAAVKDYLEAHLADTIVICLDHDLELKQSPSGETMDPGTGREVADYLAGKSPVCPVVIHTTNTSAALGMEMALRDAHWKTFRVIPFDDLAWVPTEWFRTVRKAIVRP